MGVILDSSVVIAAERRGDTVEQAHRLRKMSDCTPRQPAAAKAAIDFATLSARLKPRPFKAGSKSEYFRSLLKPLYVHRNQRKARMNETPPQTASTSSRPDCEASVAPSMVALSASLRAVRGRAFMKGWVIAGNLW